MRKFARVVPILSSYTRGTDLKAQINICMLETPSRRGIYFTSSRGIFTCRANNERSRCVQLPLAYTLSGYGCRGCVPSTPHRPTYPFPLSLSLSPSPSFPAREKSPELTLIFPRLRQPGTGSGRRCYNILHVRQSCLPESERERPRGPQIPTTRDPPTHRPHDGPSKEDE